MKYSSIRKTNVNIVVRATSKDNSVHVVFFHCFRQWGPPAFKPVKDTCRFSNNPRGRSPQGGTNTFVCVRRACRTPSCNHDAAVKNFIASFPALSLLHISIRKKSRAVNQLDYRRFINLCTASGASFNNRHSKGNSFMWKAICKQISFNFKTFAMTIK